MLRVPFRAFIHSFMVLSGEWLKLIKHLIAYVKVVPMSRAFMK